MTNLKKLASFFKLRYLWRSSFKLCPLKVILRQRDFPQDIPLQALDVWFSLLRKFYARTDVNLTGFTCVNKIRDDVWTAYINVNMFRGFSSLGDTHSCHLDLLNLLPALPFALPEEYRPSPLSSTVNLCLNLPKWDFFPSTDNLRRENCRASNICRTSVY